MTDDSKTSGSFADKFRKPNQSPDNQGEEDGSSCAPHFADKFGGARAAGAPAEFAKKFGGEESAGTTSNKNASQKKFTKMRGIKKAGKHGEGQNFSKDLQRKRLNCIFLVRGKDKEKGLQAWHYVMVDPLKRELFLAQSRTGSIDIAKFGKILKSGWGENPPEEVVKYIENNYGGGSSEDDEDTAEDASQAQDEPDTKREAKKTAGKKTTEENTSASKELPLPRQHRTAGNKTNALKDSVPKSSEPKGNKVEHNAPVVRRKKSTIAKDGNSRSGRNISATTEERQQLKPRRRIRDQSDKHDVGSDAPHAEKRRLHTARDLSGHDDDEVVYTKKTTTTINQQLVVNYTNEEDHDPKSDDNVRSIARPHDTEEKKETFRSYVFHAAKKWLSTTRKPKDKLEKESSDDEQN